MSSRFGRFREPCQRRSGRTHPYYRSQGRPSHKELPKSGLVSSNRHQDEDRWEERRQRGNTMHSRSHKYPCGTRTECIESSATTEMAQSGKSRKSWADMMEEEELEQSDNALQHFKAAEERDCHGRYLDEFQQRDYNDKQKIESKCHRRQNSITSNASSRDSETSDSSKNSKKSSTPTPRYTNSELQTPDVQAILKRREKQIEYGKNQECYKQYIKLVPMRNRTKFHPRTPDMHRKYSRRSFDMLIRTWKKQLHVWEPKTENDVGKMLDLSGESSTSTHMTSDSAVVKTKVEEKGESDWWNHSMGNHDSIPVNVIKIEPIDDSSAALSDVKREVKTDL